MTALRRGCPDHPNLDHAPTVHYPALNGCGCRVLGACDRRRVEQQRKHRGWTLDRLATFAGVSRHMPVNVEQRSVNPSVDMVVRLSDALVVVLPTLVEVDGVRDERAPGDASSCHGEAAHPCVNMTDASARFSLAVSEPGVGPAHRTGTPDA